MTDYLLPVKFFIREGGRTRGRNKRTEKELEVS
jgi:hypothetical protein